MYVVHLSNLYSNSLRYLILFAALLNASFWSITPIPSKLCLACLLILLSRLTGQSLGIKVVSLFKISYWVSLVGLKNYICFQPTSVKILVLVGSPTIKIDSHNETVPSLFPFNYRECMCPNKEVKTMDLMGCKDGGFPRCKDIDGQIYNEGPFSMMDDMVCPASSKHITTKDFMTARLLKSTKCLCEDSRVPICVRGTSSTGVCPDGSNPDTSNVIMPPFLKNCSPRKWIFAKKLFSLK